VPVRCVETGRGPKGSVFVCWTPRGDVVLKAKKVGSYKYDVFSEVPHGEYKATIYASSRSELRRRIEGFLNNVLGLE